MANPIQIEPEGSSGPQRRVEELFGAHIRDPLAPRPEEVQCLVAELAVHQVELEEQIDELRQTQQHLEEYRDRYIDLYDFAPLGYATLDEDGYVQEINLAGAKLLGVERDALTGYVFGDYVIAEDQKFFLDHVRECVGERREVTSELRFVTKDNRSIAVQLHSIPIEGPKEETLCKTAIMDITQRRNMEEALRKSRAFLQTVIDAIPDIMLVISREYRIVLANRAAREMAAGIDPTVCMICHQLSHHRALPCEGLNDPCPLRQVIATKAPMTVTHTHYNAEGKEVFVEISAAPVFNEAGEVTHIIEVCRDITDRKRAEEALEHERNLLRTLIDNLPDYIYIKDAQGRFVTANLAAARIMGATTPDELLGKTDYDFYPPELAAEYRADEEQLFISGKPVINKDEPHLDDSGNPRTVMTTKVPLKDSQGNVTGLVGISRDITERKQAEKALRMTQFAVDHAADAVFWVGRNAGFVYVNSKACEELGYSQEELFSLTVHDIDPNYTPEVWPNHWDELKQRGSITFETQHITKDGRLIPVEITGNYLEFEGSEYNCAFVRDITERKRTEEVVRAAQQHVLELQLHEKELVKTELDKARETLVRQIRLAAVGQLSATIAHELRTPLASIRNGLLLLERKISQGPGVYNEYLEMIREELKRANQIVTNCTSISRGGAPAKSPVELSAVIDGALAHLVIPKEIEWRSVFDPEQFIIYADALQMQQVFRNLFLNAIQALDGPGRIAVEAARLGLYDEIRVMDNGPGVPLDLRDRVFEPLITTKPSGIGLGLTICQQIVEQHGGHIELLSGDGPGTAFLIRLPVLET